MTLKFVVDYWSYCCALLFLFLLL